MTNQCDSEKGKSFKNTHKIHENLKKETFSNKKSIYDKERKIFRKYS